MHFVSNEHRGFLVTMTCDLKIDLSDLAKFLLLQTSYTIQLLDL